jgi:iron complex transport system substrate-binding protein
MYFIVAFIAATLCMFSMTSCRKSKKMDAKNIKSIVSLSPAVTEIIFLLGEQDRLVGVTDQCNYPPQARNIFSIGGFGQPNIERIVSLKPDIIISTDTKSHPTYAKLQSLGMNIQDIETHSFDDAFKMIVEVGKLIGVPEKAKKAAAELRAQTHIISLRHEDEPTSTRVYVEVGYNPIFTVGKNSFNSDMIRLLGAENIFDDVDKPFPQVSSEAVIKRDPEVIILSPVPGGGSALESVRRRPGWANITAVREGRVYSDIDPDLYQRPGPRSVQGLLEFERVIYGGENPSR